MGTRFDLSQARSRSRTAIEHTAVGPQLDGLSHHPQHSPGDIDSVDGARQRTLHGEMGGPERAGGVRVDADDLSDRKVRHPGRHSVALDRGCRVILDFQTIDAHAAEARDEAQDSRSSGTAPGHVVIAGVEPRASCSAATLGVDPGSTDAASIFVAPAPKAGSTGTASIFVTEPRATRLACRAGGLGVCDRQ